MSALKEIIKLLGPQHSRMERGVLSVFNFITDKHKCKTIYIFSISRFASLHKRLNVLLYTSTTYISTGNLMSQASQISSLHQKNPQQLNT